MGRPERIQFFVTNAHDCSYLEDKQATAIFADPYSPMTPHTFGALLEIGFRRSGDYIYKPRCQDCQACIPVRVPTAVFSLSKSQKRILKKNTDLIAQTAPAQFRDEDYELYEAYINGKHVDGGMHPPSVEQYKSFLFCQWSNSQFIRFFLDDTLVCVSVIDQLPQGVSAVYTFYHPGFEGRSLGTYGILWNLSQCQKQQISYLYLGYWIKACRKMNYKDQFKPFEIFVNDQWQIHQTEENA